MYFNLINKIKKGSNEILNYRFERKFTSENISAFGVEQVILNHQACFKEIFHERYVNNIYFDTQNLTHYYDNSFGKAQRRKYRIRWYNDLLGNIINPVLEIKIKNGLLGKKESYALHRFKTEKGENISQIIKKCLEKSDLPENVSEEMKILIPTLVNRYKRKYFLDFSKKYRITLDSEIEYYNILKGEITVTNKIRDCKKIVTELKYSSKDSGNASFIASQLPFSLTKNSKYINGIELFYKISD